MKYFTFFSLFMASFISATEPLLTSKSDQYILENALNQTSSIPFSNVFDDRNFSSHLCSQLGPKNCRQVRLINTFYDADKTHDLAFPWAKKPEKPKFYHYNLLRLKGHEKKYRYCLVQPQSFFPQETRCVESDKDDHWEAVSNNVIKQLSSNIFQRIEIIEDNEKDDLWFQRSNKSAGMAFQTCLKINKVFKNKSKFSKKMKRCAFLINDDCKNENETEACRQVDDPNSSVCKVFQCKNKKMMPITSWSQLNIPKCSEKNTFCSHSKTIGPYLINYCKEKNDNFPFPFFCKKLNEAELFSSSNYIALETPNVSHCSTLDSEPMDKKTKDNILENIKTVNKSN